MKKLIAALMLSALIATPAFAGEKCDKAKCPKDKAAKAQSCPSKDKAACPTQAKKDCKTACSKTASKQAALTKGAETLKQ